ncbi:MAG: hypothetical protein EA411_05860 [Saprospirales bacterium]|nr:MAG: hypothetical protein EA411_05860 [Saprospirales bacterium]
MSWGYKILFLYLGFVAIILTLVVSSFGYEVQVVAENYYERELHQQDVIDGTFNMRDLGEKPEIVFEDSGMYIHLPESLSEKTPKSGELWLYNVMRYQQDYKFEFEDHEEVYFTVPAPHLTRGNFILKLRWSQDGTPYYFEERVNLN